MLVISKNDPHSSHTGVVLNPKTLAEIGEVFRNRIVQEKIEFDAIAFRGNSGAIIAGYLSVLLEKPLIMVRKEMAISNRKVESLIDPRFVNNVRYIIVDDLISSGDTVNDIIDTVTQFYDVTKLVGIFLYRSYSGGYYTHHNKDNNYPIFAYDFTPEKIRNL